MFELIVHSFAWRIVLERWRVSSLMGWSVGLSQYISGLWQVFFVSGWGEEFELVVRRRIGRASLELGQAFSLT